MVEKRWKILDEFPDYRVSTNGEIESRKSGVWKPLKQTNRNGYLKVNLCNHSGVHSINVNNLVWDAFIGRPDGYIYNHKNGIKSDNRVENLEPSTQSENRLHAYRTGLQNPAYNQPRSIPVRIVETGEVFPSTHACARHLDKGSQGDIYECLKNPKKTHKGYHYEYA